MHEMPVGITMPEHTFLSPHECSSVCASRGLDQCDKRSGSGVERSRGGQVNAHLTIVCTWSEQGDRVGEEIS
jgi:hypothetical protein